MIDITRKTSTLREAKAAAKVVCHADTAERIQKNDLPKGNLFEIAKAAALLGAKNTSLLIPHCHPVALDYLDIRFEVEPSGVNIFAHAKSIGRTGIEMEALTACSVAALTIYDLLKPIDKNLEISSIKLTEKKGGKSQYLKDIKKDTSVAVLVCSDSTFAGKREDRSGKKIIEILSVYNNIKIADFQVVPDNREKIQEQIKKWAAQDIPYIFTTGGTGLGPTDITVESIREIIQKEATGIAEAMRSFGQMKSPRAMLSRSIAGLVNSTLIITLPGSRKGVEESLDAIIPSVFHARQMILGGGHDE
jgi:molybdenum cofactor biosynthesis protein MoaC